MFQTPASQLMPSMPGSSHLTRGDGREVPGMLGAVGHEAGIEMWLIVRSRIIVSAAEHGPGIVSKAIGPKS